MQASDVKKLKSGELVMFHAGASAYHVAVVEQLGDRVGVRWPDGFHDVIDDRSPIWRRMSKHEGTP
jgi:hypothetical protein